MLTIICNIKNYCHYLPVAELNLNLPVHCNGCQGEDAGVNTEVLEQRSIKYYYNLSAQYQ